MDVQPTIHSFGSNTIASQETSTPNLQHDLHFSVYFQHVSRVAVLHRRPLRRATGDGVAKMTVLLIYWLFTDGQVGSVENLSPRFWYSPRHRCTYEHFTPNTQSAVRQTR